MYRTYEPVGMAKEINGHNYFHTQSVVNKVHPFAISSKNTGCQQPHLINLVQKRGVYELNQLLEILRYFRSHNCRTSLVRNTLLIYYHGTQSSLAALSVMVHSFFMLRIKTSPYSMKQKLLCILHIKMFSRWVFMQMLAFGCSPSLSLSTELKAHTRMSK